MSKKTRRNAPPKLLKVKHKGVTWEGLAGNHLWTWMPYVEHGDFESINVFDDPRFPVSLRFRGGEHQCVSREAAFDLAVELVEKAALLDVFHLKIGWRIRELERRFGHLL